MSPTIVLKDGKPVLVTGTPGGSRIISAVLQIVVDVHRLQDGCRRRRGGPARAPSMDAGSRCGSNAAFPTEVLDELRAKGHEVIEPLGQTSANSIAVTPNGLLGAPDPRTRGAEAAGQ